MTFPPLEPDPLPGPVPARPDIDPPDGPVPEPDDPDDVPEPDVPPDMPVLEEPVPAEFLRRLNHYIWTGRP